LGRIFALLAETAEFPAALTVRQGPRQHQPPEFLTLANIFTPGFALQINI